MWIEIDPADKHITDLMSQPARAVWIEIDPAVKHITDLMSQPARAVWIEISKQSFCTGQTPVTACEGCVD